MEKDYEKMGNIISQTSNKCCNCFSGDLGKNPSIWKWFILRKNNVKKKLSYGVLGWPTGGTVYVTIYGVNLLEIRETAICSDCCRNIKSNCQHLFQDRSEKYPLLLEKHKQKKSLHKKIFLPLGIASLLAVIYPAIQVWGKGNNAFLFLFFLSLLAILIFWSGFRGEFAGKEPEKPSTIDFDEEVDSSLNKKHRDMMKEHITSETELNSATLLLMPNYKFDCIDTGQTFIASSDAYEQIKSDGGYIFSATKKMDAPGGTNKFSMSIEELRADIEKGYKNCVREWIETQPQL